MQFERADLHNVQRMAVQDHKPCRSLSVPLYVSLSLCREGRLSAIYIYHAQMIYIFHIYSFQICDSNNNRKELGDTDYVGERLSKLVIVLRATFMLGEYR